MLLPENMQYILAMHPSKMLSWLIKKYIMSTLINSFGLWTTAARKQSFCAFVIHPFEAEEQESAARDAPKWNELETKRLFPLIVMKHFFLFQRRNFLCQEWSYYFFGVKCFVTIMFLKTNQDNSIKKLSRWTIIEFNCLSCFLFFDSPINIRPHSVWRNSEREKCTSIQCS